MLQLVLSDNLIDASAWQLTSMARSGTLVHWSGHNKLHPSAAAPSASTAAAAAAAAGQRYLAQATLPDILLSTNPPLSGAAAAPAAAAGCRSTFPAWAVLQHSGRVTTTPRVLSFGMVTASYTVLLLLLPLLLPSAGQRFLDLAGLLLIGLVTTMRHGRGCGSLWQA
jgi:hypothetical protein